MDKKYNGFNNGRDTTDGVGGREVNHGTQETMTKCTLSDNELINESFKWVKRLADTGGYAWTLRVPVDFNNDPDILFCELGNRLKEKDQQLSAEREAHKKEIERILSAVARGENLADSLNFDWKSELDKERERAGKLVEALKMCLYGLCDKKEEYQIYMKAKQTLNEYDTATKES